MALPRFAAAKPFTTDAVTRSPCVADEGLVRIQPTDARITCGTHCGFREALDALEDAFATAFDVPQLQQALFAWAQFHLGCEAIELLREPPPADCAAPLASLAEAGGRVDFVLHVGIGAPMQIALRTALTRARVTPELQSLVRAACRLCTLRVAQIGATTTLSRAQGSVDHCTIAAESTASGTLIEAGSRLASSNVTVLVTGETGVGKTFLARHLHDTGSRRTAPFRVINCGAIPEHLLESELFGHERGAFTGAVSARAGALESAGSGTVLLDEIGELPLSSQVKLLRALEDRCFERVGSNRTIFLQARIIAATNRDLDAMVGTGAFRGDLFFRISVIRVHVPALRERPDEVVHLAERTLETLLVSTNSRVRGFSTEALDALRRYSWPGNIRELRNAIEHALVFADGRQIEVVHLPESVRTGAGHAAALQNGAEATSVTLPAPLGWLEQRAIEAALRAAGGNKVRAASMLGIRPATLYYKLRAHPARSGSSLSGRAAPSDSDAA